LVDQNQYSSTYRAAAKAEELRQHLMRILATLEQQKKEKKVLKEKELEETLESGREEAAQGKMKEGK
jgi:hypothetical protein